MDAFLFITLLVGSAALLSWPLGRYLKWAMDPAQPDHGLAGRKTRGFQFIGGSIARQSQDWKQYTVSLLVFNVVLFAVSFGFLALQQHLPLNPDGQVAAEHSLVFNTAASFTTNTNLQHYSGESTWSYLSQLTLMWLQFVTPAVGLAALVAMARGLAGRTDVGNFFVDVQRATFLVLLPLALIVASLMILGGMPMTLQGAAKVLTLEGIDQTISRGPVAAFLTIKQLGTNGGGFFGPNSTHPLENPTFWTNCLSSIAILLVPMACVWMFGRIVGRLRHAAVVFGVMLLFLALKIGGAVYFEQAPTQAFADLPIEQTSGNLEGKELRFGTAAGPLWAVLTTSTSNGSVNAMHDSLNPMTGLMPMAGMWLNTTFGGVGVGLINMFLYIVIAVFVAGMMVGRTPEYLGRRIEAREVKLAVLALFVHAFLVLAPTALFAATPWGVDALNNTGAHGFSEILYEFSSASANNGSGFEGLGDNTVPWNVATGLVMLLGRFIPIILPLAIAGSLAAKRPAARSSGTLGVEDGTFGLMLFGTIVFVGALTFFPAAALGPIAEHLQFMK
ncbi:MAG: potassium-transporting ATPase subunit A [Opitutaceae bacterium]|nr:potassium-transporting ATPase subunit A [Cephaloticoccus sp.]MCP5529814.1 potassium-transporting ATPase subunit A [Opitutaceae bacterium]